MFYEELYAALGKLFYYVAASDSKVTESEKATLQSLIQNTWKPLEASTDNYGTDQANLIGFAFDYEDAEGPTENGFQAFESFYRQNKAEFSPAIISNIKQTARAIASAYKDKNKDEEKVLSKIDKLFNS